jgi:Family of unknown function (DUF5678)
VTQVQQELDRFRGDVLYFEENRAELLRRYPDRWIAVYNKEVVGTAKDPAQLFRKLRQKGIPPGHVVHEYLTENDELLIL